MVEAMARQPGASRAQGSCPRASPLIRKHQAEELSALMARRSQQTSPQPSRSLPTSMMKLASCSSILARGARVAASVLLSCDAAVRLS